MPNKMDARLDIRAAVAEDLDAVEAIEQECFGADGDAFARRQLRYLMLHAQGAFLVACRDGVVVGYISLLARREASNLRIYSVAVAPAARGCGAGQCLVEAAIAEARRRSLGEVTLEVRADNTSAQRLYMRNGFVVSRTLKGYYHDGSDGLRMRLEVGCGGE